MTRSVVQIVEFDIERCSLAYSNSPCTAVLGDTGQRKCFNTFATCQDRPNFARVTETLRFGLDQSGLPEGERIYPCLVSVSTNPIEISVGGSNPRIGSLGKRARVNIQLKDFTDSDIWFDQYFNQRRDGTAQADGIAYDPETRGTFFGRLRARFPYYVTRPIRVLEGLEGQDLADYTVRHYVVTEWEGPDASGNVRIVASDVLDLARDNKAQCPRPTNGRLTVDIADEGEPTFDLSPPGIGDEQYDAIGLAAIGSEIVGFNRSGDSITITSRGRGGSSISDHAVGDTFQQCYFVDNNRISTVAHELMTEYAGIDSSLIDLSAWRSEDDRWFAGTRLDTIVTKPTGVTTLLAELGEFGVNWWQDDRTGQIRMRTTRPLDIGETAPALSDAVTVIEDTGQVKDLYDQRLSRVLFFHGVLDYTGNVTSDADNYRRLSVPIDAEAEGPNEYNKEQTHEVFCRWLGRAGDFSVATPVAARIVQRFRDTPRQMVFEFDHKDLANIQIASPVTMVSRLLQDDTGASTAAQMQVTSIQDVTPLHRYRAKIQTYVFTGRFGFITENSRPDYSASTDAQRAQGTYIVDESALEFPDGTGPYILF